MKFLSIFLFCLPLSIWAQKDAQFSMSVSSDTVGLNGQLEVTFTLKNAQGKRFTAPQFNGFAAQGPSTSMMTSITNGEMTQQHSYTFYLTPNEVGTFEIPAASVEINGETLRTEPKSIVVVEKYAAEIRPKQRNNFWSDDDFFFPRRSTPQPTPAPEKPKKKYQTERL
jgi:hypothetical protein